MAPIQIAYRCDLSGRRRYPGAGTPPTHCDAAPATATPRQCIAASNASWQLQSGCGPTGRSCTRPMLQREQLGRVLAQAARLVDGAGVEVDMGVVALDTLHDELRIQCAPKPRPQSTAGPARSTTARCWLARPPASRQTAGSTAPGVCAGAAPRNSRSARSPCHRSGGTASPAPASHPPGAASRWPRPGRRSPPGSAGCSCRSAVGQARVPW